jgi:hypothetical protein
MLLCVLDRQPSLYVGASDLRLLGTMVLATTFSDYPVIDWVFQMQQLLWYTKKGKEDEIFASRRATDQGT